MNKDSEREIVKHEEKTSERQVIQSVLEAEAEEPFFQALAAVKAMHNEQGQPTFWGLPSGWERIAANNIARVLEKVRETRENPKTPSEGELQLFQGFMRLLGY